MRRSSQSIDDYLRKLVHLIRLPAHIMVFGVPEDSYARYRCTRKSPSAFAPGEFYIFGTSLCRIQSASTPVCVCVLFLSGTYITRSDVQHVASLRGLAAPLNYQVTETI